MPRTLDGESQRLLRTLFGGGSALGLSDGQLLERFNARDGTSAERAFSAIVQRHGPMVLRVARSILRDRTLAEDAFQAAFLALARRAGSLWVQDSIGPWLHAVTVRVSTRMRSDLARRRSLDDRAARLAPTSCDPIEPDDLGAAVHEEIARLPDRHRLPIVLCLVEGLTHDQAADRLGWPVGTVRSRLARGRDRLSRRGLAPSILPITLGIGRSASEVVGPSLLAATSRAAVSLSNGGLIAATGMVPAAAITAAITVLKETSMIHRAMLILGLVTSGVLAAGATLSAQSKPEAKPDRGPSMRAVLPREGEATITRVYPVGDLVMSRRPQARDGMMAMSAEPVTIEWVSGTADFGPLVDLITETVAPGTWTLKYFDRNPNSGEPISGDRDLVDFGSEPLPPGSIRAFYLNLSLIITHSPEVHDQVVERLRQLRRIVDQLGTPETHNSGQTFDLELVPSQSPSLNRMNFRLAPPPPAAPGGVIHSESPSADPGVVVADPGVVVEDVPTGRRTLYPRGLPGPEADDSARRIDALEQKLDAILEELRAIRKDNDR